MKHFSAAFHACFLVLALLSIPRSAPAASAADKQLHAAESRFADFFDAAGALATIDSGYTARFDGLDRAAWQKRFDQSLKDVKAAVAAISEQELSPGERRALEGIRSGIAWRTSASLAPAGNCGDASRPNATGHELRVAMYACFSSAGDAIEFEGATYSRTAALALLEHLPAPERRHALFMAMAPLWRAVNADNEAQSPYRRMFAAEAARAQANIRSAEVSLGLAPGTGEHWLEQALEAWSGAQSGPGSASAGGPAQLATVEPWDFRYSYASGSRAVQGCARGLQTSNTRFFDDLGASLTRLQVIEDISARPGMAPVDYADFARIGRRVGGAWRPAIPRVSVLLKEESFAGAAELAHENGHAVHYAGMRARPSLLLPDDFSLAVEAFADITGWSVYNPAWQRKYLGCGSTDAEGLRARLGGVILDLAWGLFESRMASSPTSDPNAVWTDITSRYLHIAPHPELSWWAVRGQLVDEPGYMITYALGAFVTADLRARIREQIGEFDAGNPQWFPYLSTHLFRYGGELEPSELLRQFLGRPVTQNALLEDLRKMNSASRP